MSLTYPHIIPDIKSWPIYKLSQDRSNFVKEIVDANMDQYKAMSKGEMEDILSKTIFSEIKRCKEDPWKVDPRNEIRFWRGIRGEMDKIVQDDQSAQARLDLLERIANRYAEEIVGKFKIGTFKKARRLLSFLFRRLLNSASGKNHTRLWGTKHQLYERILVKGAVEKVRKLSEKGTVVMVPTHFSNLDSILIGYAIDGIAGLPAFNYGAGLNLYDLELVAYFINRLGAYKVDRRKKNPIYLSTLKTMSLLSVKRGVNNLFFPGGTRSRSGELEQELKLGLLGTVVQAQREHLEEKSDEKIFVVPLIISYHFVLESKYLIEQHLKKTGQEHYLGGKDAGKSHIKLMKFIWDLFAQGSEIYLTMGEPIDVVGNQVDEEGRSYDRQSKQVDLEEYFKLHGEVKPNIQREQVYTKILAERIVKSYHKYNMVLSSHVIAFTLFYMIRDMFPSDTIYTLVGRETETIRFSYDDFKKRIEYTQDILMDLAANDRIQITNVIKGDADKLIETGIKNMSTYHVNKPVKINENRQVISEDLKLLLYYSNRLEHYDIDQELKHLMSVKEV